MSTGGSERGVSTGTGRREHAGRTSITADKAAAAPGSCGNGLLSSTSPSGSSKCIWGHFTGRQQAPRGELIYPKPHGQAAVGLSLGPGGGQGEKLLEGAATTPGAPQVGVGRPASH